MKPLKLKFSVLPLFFTILLFSCANQAPPKNDTPTPVTEIPFINTPLRLNFPNGIRAILEDANGNTWFGSHNEGVCLFDGTKMTYFTEEHGLSDNQVRSIFEDANGIVWFECGEGISSYDGEKIITHSIKNYDSKNEWQLNKNDLWFKGDESIGNHNLEGLPGVYRSDGKALFYHVFPLSVGKNMGTYSVSTPFAKGKNDRVWFGTYSAVIGYDGEDFTIIDNKSLDLSPESGLHVRGLFEDSKGNLWIGNNGIGVLKYDGKTTINFSRQQNVISMFSQLRGGYRSPAGSLEHVFSIGEDSEGNIWFGDRDTGAWRFNPSVLSGENSMTNFTTKDGLTTTHIWEIYNAKNGELWFAMGDGSVCKFDGEAELFERIF